MESSTEPDSIYSLGCQLCQRFSTPTSQDKLSKYEDYVDNAQTSKRHKLMMQRHKKKFFGLLLKKENTKETLKYVMPVKDRISATAFELEMIEEKKKSEELISNFSNLDSNSRIDAVLCLLLNLEDIKPNPHHNSNIRMGSSIDDYGDDFKSYKEFPSTLFNKDPGSPPRTSKSYKLFTPDMFKKSLDDYDNVFKLQPSLGLDTRSSRESTNQSEDDKESTNQDEGYMSPSPGQDADVWEKMLTGEGCTKMTWESLGQRTFIQEKPFLTEAGHQATHQLWKSGSKISFIPA